MKWLKKLFCKKSEPDKLVDRIVEFVKHTLRDIKKEKTWDLKKVANLIKRIVLEVEFYSSKVIKLSKEDKVQVVVDVLNAFVDIPYIPEVLERTIFMIIIKSVMKKLNIQ